ncbi:MAG: hypothetical protein SVR04_12520 [Spirochaetota bacterium]|nr:hypothetical protein [Spirochaetota bacterium]
MKKFCIFTLLISAVLLTNLYAEGQKFGLGVIAGEPTGITAKMYLSENDAVDAAASWSFVKDRIHLHADYIRHFPGVIDREFDDFVLYAGVGGLVELDDESEFGARIPVGVNYYFNSVPVELFLEIGPALLLIPETRFEFTGGIGARYYF